MSLDLEEFAEYKRTIETIKRDKAKGEGALGEVLKRLKKETGSDNENTAEKEIKKLDNEIAELEGRLSEMFEEFKERWKDKLDD